MLLLDNEFVENIAKEVGEDVFFNKEYGKQFKDAAESVLCVFGYA